MTTLAGSTPGFADDTGGAAMFNFPRGMAVAADNSLYVADQNNNRIRKVTTGGTVSTLAGSTNGFAEGTGAAAQFSTLSDVAVDAGGTVYVGDTYNDRIRKVTSGGVATTLAGSSSGFADDVVVVYGVAGLSYSNNGLVVGTSYTYTVKAIGPGTVSNTIGPFVP